MFSEMPRAQDNTKPKPNEMVICKCPKKARCLMRISSKTTFSWVWVTKTRIQCPLIISFRTIRGCCQIERMRTLSTLPWLIESKDNSSRKWVIAPHCLQTSIRLIVSQVQQMLLWISQFMNTQNKLRAHLCNSSQSRSQKISTWSMPS